jgi:hypothetical protein
MDSTFSKELHTGMFVGINEFGHARIKKSFDHIEEIFEGRMVPF